MNFRSKYTGLTPDQLQEMIDMMEDQLNINYTEIFSRSGINLDIQMALIILKLFLLHHKSFRLQFLQERIYT